MKNEGQKRLDGKIVRGFSRTWQLFQEDGIHVCLPQDGSAPEGLQNKKSLHHGRASSKQREDMGTCEEPIHVYEVRLERQAQAVIWNH